MGTANQKTTIDKHTPKKEKATQNRTLKIVIKSHEKRTKEEEKKKDLQKQIQNS